MTISPGLALFKMAYELSPIVFTGGIASGVPGGALPIILITETLNFVDGILSGGEDLDLDDFFAHFQPLPGSKLAANQFGQYPFANQSVAANARIAQPFTISLRMICPVKDTAGWAVKLATMTALQAAFSQHDSMGGTYTIATPSYFYTNCVLLDMTDTSHADSKQPQNTYQLDFWQPLLTLQSALQAQNNLMSQITNGTPISGVPSYSGAGPTVGNPSSLATIGNIPASTNAPGSQTAAPNIGINQ